MQLSKMNDTAGNVAHYEEWTDGERAEILDETNRILADPAFKNSKRCQALFRWLVDRSLAGDHEGIKERTVGIEVFGRTPDYDTAIDPVVRITANEIRKRLAQWYQEPAHHQRIRVRLTAGAYLLKFEFVQPDSLPEILETKTEVETPSPIAMPEVNPESAHPAAIHAIPESEFDIQTESVALLHAAPLRSRSRWIWGVAATCFVMLTVVLIVRRFEIFEPRDYLVWKPLLSSTQPLILTISDASPLVIPDGNTNWQVIADAIANRVAPVDPGPVNLTPTTPLGDAVVSQEITNWLAMHGQRSFLRGSSTVSVQDLRQGPIVLVGGFNPWSLILLSNLRYSIRVDRVTHAKWIQDAQNPSKRDWMIDGNNQPAGVDYAVISRFLDSETGHWILAMGGLWPQGTLAAGDLLTNSSFIQGLPAQIKSTGNFQIVLKTNFINGSAGPPQILAVHTW